MLTYVVHVSSDHARKAHMEAELGRQGLVGHYITAGDKADLSEAVLAHYFRGKMAQVCNVASCAYKHFLAYEALLQSPAPMALVFEDDAFLAKNFRPALAEAQAEIQARGLKGIIISLEDSGLRYVPGSQRRPGQRLYRQASGRMAAAYLIDRAGAEALLAEVAREGCALTLDWFHNHCADKGLIDIYWLHPTIATQGSLDGRIGSHLDERRPRQRWRAFAYGWQRRYKQCLWALR